jgi:hypothetical protein
MTKHNNFTSDLLANTTGFLVTLDPAFETALELEKPEVQTFHRVMAFLPNILEPIANVFLRNNFVGLENG